MTKRVRMAWEIFVNENGSLQADLNGGMNCVIPLRKDNLHYLESLKAEMEQTKRDFRATATGIETLDFAIEQLKESERLSDFDRVVKAINRLNIENLTLVENRGSIIIKFDDYKEETAEELNARAMDLVEVVKLTEKEEELLRAIPYDNFYESGFESILWTRIFIDDAGLDKRKSRGVLSSLVKKGFIFIDEDPEEENEWSRSTLGMTQKAVDWLKNKSGIEFNEYGDRKETNPLR